MEYATALLLAESAFENFNNLSPEFPSQVDAMLERLDAARAGRFGGRGGADARRDVAAVRRSACCCRRSMREMQVNLRHMEQVLDAFFRDHTQAFRARRARQRTASRFAARCACSGWTTPIGCSSLCQTADRKLRQPRYPVDEEGLELLAESLSGLGFYIEAVQHQRPDRERIIAPLIAKRLGEAPRPVVAQPRIRRRRRWKNCAPRCRD